ncbi:hypothetical protein F4813DRAFT_377641 [Daldinia decipiens]|uniref:uncharacterized protein n=1 Tax=Daldinia decipiens TaxID=326647 RepID=UPI0020C222D1|nr:uncharacterized protein F4813DRAFT_377641 [Daldinia decipiens]KAI1652565.1 hypothetical protein F4813DRAFT_377641 [Daldinia decipiens]
MGIARGQSKLWKPARKARSLLERQFASPRDYKLRMSSGWTISDGTYTSVPEDRKTKRNVPYPTYIHEAYRATFGLNTLQLARNAPITLCAMDVATDYLWKCAPPFIQSEVSIHPPNGPALWSQDESHQEAIYQETERQTAKRGKDVYGVFKAKPWGIWPLWVEDQWGSDYVLLVWYADGTDASPDFFDTVTMATLYDPRRYPLADKDGWHHPIIERRERLEGQVQKFFKRAGFDTSKLVFKEGHVSPMPLGETTSGERCFAAVKELLECIMNFYLDIAQGAEQDFSNGFWNLSQWVNPYQYRVEMTGINAWVLMAAFDYNARIAVECVEPNIKTEVVVDGRRRLITPKNLAGSPIPPNVSADNYLLPPSPESDSKSA